MNRETTTILTPVSKIAVEIKTYITGREKRALAEAYFSKDIQVNAETKQVTGIDLSQVNRAEEKAWEIVIVSVDGSKEGVANAILDMRAEDYSFVVAKVNEITSDASFEKKTKN